jgi:hypothetical protein
VNNAIKNWLNYTQNGKLQNPISSKPTINEMSRNVA